ncbi:MAG: helix-turn-helix domain-containing protein [Rhodobacteraceae bacterium]|nr:helix-turn-helix domain-containing protein [Paracoccaceae bacterium]
MSITRISIDPDDPSTFPEGRIDAARVDATTELGVAMQEREDEAEALQDTARYTLRIRRRMGLSQTELARRIDVSPETIRNWEQGKRYPTGAARALLRVLDKAPEIALRVLT